MGRRKSRKLACGCALVGMLLAVGCAKKAPASHQPAPAHLVVINVTDYAWRLAITAADGADPRSEQVPPRAELTIKLAGGNYEVEQASVSANATPDLTRRMSFRLESGLTYRWRLATLLSDNPANPP